MRTDHAARVATRLSEEPDTRIETIRGGLGQFDVFVDGRSVVKTNRFCHPNPRRAVERVLAVLKG